MRALDFRNLAILFDDISFPSVQREFFADELKQFYHAKDNVLGRHKSPSKKARFQTVDAFPTLNAIGEAVTQKTTLLDELSGHFSQRFLPQWAARSPKLQSLVLWDGEALANGVGDAIRQNCHLFRDLRIHGWLASDADEVFAVFLSSLSPNTLESFYMISFSNIALQSFIAFGQHATSLTELRLNNLSREATLALGKLKPCTALKLLELEDNQGSLQLETTQNDVFVDIVEWLSACSELRDLKIRKFYDGTSILAQVLSSHYVRLTKLSLEGYVVNRVGSNAFHVALQEQPSLQSIWLKGHGEDVHPSDLDTMVDSLCTLTGLRELNLRDVSDEFDESHILRLAASLANLEEFWTSGGNISTVVLSFFAAMKHLKSLSLMAMTNFTADETIEFISQLNDETNRGFSLALLAAESDLTEEEQADIREKLRTKLDGNFDFVPWREAEASDSEDD